MSFFDDSHVTEVGLEGSIGPSVGFGEMVRQGFRQQFRVDSARALDDELRNRWLASLRAAQITDLRGTAPDPLGRNASIDPDDPWAYRAFAQHVAGQPIDAFDPNRPLWGYDPTDRLQGMIEANEKIKALNNPNIKSFEQILEEVSQMQQEVEGETASMSERSGTKGFVGSLIGAIGGSLTLRDPLNIITAPIGVGRTVATRIASEMGLAAAVTGYTEVSEVTPARQIAGLPERNPLLNIAAATIGAGVIRGGIEGIGYGVRRLRGENIDFDLRDTQLRQMFEANADKPSARAGASILDDVQFIERNNPYGDGHQANTRFLAELQSVQRAMNGEPMTAVARAMPPVPFEQLKKVADFEIVREQAPQVYAKMEAAQAKIAPVRLEELTGEGPQRTLIYHSPTTKEEVEIFLRLEEDGTAHIALNPNDFRANKLGITEVRRVQDAIEEMYPQITKFTGERISGAGEGRTQVVAARRAANVEYRAAYREVEAEAGRLREQQARVESTQQRETASILASEGLPFTGPIMRYDVVESLAERINKFNDTLDERTAARFVRETLGEGENKVEVEVWEKDGGIDIGLKDPVDPNFKFMTDEGEMTVAQAMRDLQDDTDLVEAVKGCAI